MMNTHEKMKSLFEEYLAENERFTNKGVKAAAARARKALGELRKLAGDRRKEIQAEKLAATPAQ
jgi:hypothetical protein